MGANRVGSAGSRAIGRTFGAIATLVILVVLSTAHATALPLQYDEAIDGDIVNGSSLNLDIGTNIIRGTVTSRGSCCTEVDFDKFDALFSGLVLIEQVSLSIRSLTGVYPSWFEYQLQAGGAVLQHAVPGAGLYEIPLGVVRDSLLFVGLNSFPTNVNAAYEIAIVASAAPVPVPGSGWLLGLALMCGGFFSRRRRLRHIRR